MNADGHLDYLSANFSGTVQLAMGSKTGFAQPEQMRDAAGEFILLSDYWDYEAREHLTTMRSMPKSDTKSIRCTSALAFDWDGDGDYDLLLGSYTGGFLYRQMNEGTRSEPKFTGNNIPVNAGKKHFSLPAKLTTAKLIDWDGDGDLDLIAGTYDVQHKGIGGGIYLSLNQGKTGRPQFGALTPLIPPAPLSGKTKATAPDTGLYPAVGDFDLDGDLDLVVAGYSVWNNPPRKLTLEQDARAAELKKIIRENEDKRQQIFDSTTDELSAENEAKLAMLRQKIAPYSKELEDLIPSKTLRESGVWFYERIE